MPPSLFVKCYITTVYILTYLTSSSSTKHEAAASRNTRHRFIGTQIRKTCGKVAGMPGLAC